MSRLQNTRRRARRTTALVTRTTTRRSRGTPSAPDVVADWARWRMPPGGSLL